MPDHEQLGANLLALTKSLSFQSLSQLSVEMHRRSLFRDKLVWLALVGLAVMMALDRIGAGVASVLFLGFALYRRRALRIEAECLVRSSLISSLRDALQVASTCVESILFMPRSWGKTHPIELFRNAVRIRQEGCAEKISKKMLEFDSRYDVDFNTVVLYVFFLNKGPNPFLAQKYVALYLRKAKRFVGHRKEVEDACGLFSGLESGSAEWKEAEQQFHGLISTYVNVLFAASAEFQEDIAAERF